jgi:hypothetical protein
VGRMKLDIVTAAQYPDAIDPHQTAAAQMREP